MEDINDEDYTYDVGVPWPETAERRIAALEKRLRELERIVHRLLNAGEAVEDDGK